MNIVLARIDDRLIHGQIGTIWSRETKCERIIVCNDDVAIDEIGKALLVQVAPPGVKVSVLDIEKAIEAYREPEYEGLRVLLLFTNPADIVKMVEAGVEIKSVNIGGMAQEEGKTHITEAVSIDEKDIEAFRKLHEKGVELEIRKVASDSKIDLMTKIK